jgi:hypothetical protein
MNDHKCFGNLYLFTFLIMFGVILLYNVLLMRKETRRAPYISSYKRNRKEPYITNDQFERNINIDRYYTPYNANITSKYRRKDPNGTETYVEESEPLEYPIDAVLRGDQRRAFDPLVEPSRRPSLDQIPPPEVASQLNINTRPYFDVPSVVGVLTKVHESDNTKTKMDDILQLYGAKDNVNNYKYNYYAINKNGIKLDVSIDRNSLELNNNDKVKVLNCAYMVTLYPDKFYQYNPYML